MDTIHLRKQNTCHSLKKITYPCSFFLFLYLTHMISNQTKLCKIVCNENHV